MRRRFSPEELESRRVPSVALPGITATDPSDGASPLQAPSSFTIGFDRSVVDQIDALFADFFSVEPDQLLPTIVAGDSNQDVEIDRIGADGVATPYVGGANAAPVTETITTATAADGTSRTQLVISLPPGSPTLGPGTYQIDIVPWTNLAAVFAAVEPDSAWATATDPIPIARFTVLGRGPTLSDAPALGPLGPEVRSIPGSLDPGDYRSAVALYQFTLPQGRSWQLDATVLAQAIGSPLLPALALFDASGNVLATRDAGAGSSADPIDPDLVMGLGGGTYYLGVSAAGDLPGSAGGYDPISGRPGTAGRTDPAGPFVLDLSAAPVVPATELVDFRLDYADALEPSPSELDLTFSGPVDVSALTRPDRLQSTLAVRDASGRSWPITALDYQAAEHRLRLLFSEPLPPGGYSLVSPSPGGLTDLTGRPVVGPTGGPPGVLASWTVAAPAGPRDPHDLGILWPGPINVTWDSAIARATALGAGQQADYRFVVICPGVYALQMQTGAGSIDVRIESGDGATPLSTGDLTQLSSSYVNLEPGVYDLRMIAEGTRPATVRWTLGPVALDFEKLLDNGVGQSAATYLALVAPAPGGSGPSSGPGWPGGTTSANSTGAATAGATSAAPMPPGAASTDLGSESTATALARPVPNAFGAAPLPAALLVTLESAPAGRPAPDAGHTAVVGPLADGSVTALADAGRGGPPGIRARSSSPTGRGARVGAGDSRADAEATAQGPLAGAGPVRPAGAVDPESASARADANALALAQADPLVRITGWLVGRIVGPSSAPRETDRPAADLGTTLLATAAAVEDSTDSRDPAAGGPARERPRATLAHADLGAPCALIVATALTYRLSGPVRRWRRRYHIAQATWPHPHGIVPGPASPAGPS